MAEGNNGAEHLALVVHLPTRYETVLPEDYTVRERACIFRVPATLKMQNPQAYEPYLFSLGPWYFGESLMDAQKYKMHFLNQLVSGSSDRYYRIEELEEIMSDQVQSEACEYYGGWGHISAKSRENFQKILLLDGCFIIEMLRKRITLLRRSQDDRPIFSNANKVIWFHDLFLIENQIPWFVLERLYERIRVDEQAKPLVELAIEAFYWIFSYDELQSELQIQKDETKHILDLAWQYLCAAPAPAQAPAQQDETKHILDLAWQYLCAALHILDLAWQYLCAAPAPAPAPAPENRHNIPSVTKLREAGIEIRPAKKKGILDIGFNKTEGVLEIPSLVIHPTTETIFRNLISFEQCYPFYPPKVTCYAKLLNGLVDTPEDVDLLSRKDIFSNWLDPAEVCDFLNRLHNGTNMDCLYYGQLCLDVRNYCQRRWPKWRAFYIHNYFTKPWAIISQVFAIIILVLTILQVILK